MCKNFNPSQRKWLERLAKQLVHEVVLDRDFVNNCFANDGGTKRLSVVLENQLDQVFSELNEVMWGGQRACSQCYRHLCLASSVFYTFKSSYV